MLPLVLIVSDLQFVQHVRRQGLNVLLQTQIRRAASAKLRTAGRQASAGDNAAIGVDRCSSAGATGLHVQQEARSCCPDADARTAKRVVAVAGEAAEDQRVAL